MLQSLRTFSLWSRNVFGSSLPAGDGFLFLSWDEPVKFHLVSNGRWSLGHFSLWGWTWWWRTEKACRRSVFPLVGGAGWGRAWGAVSGWRGTRSVPCTCPAPFRKPGFLQAGYVAGPGALMEFKIRWTDKTFCACLCAYLAVGKLCNLLASIPSSVKWAYWHFLQWDGFKDSVGYLRHLVYVWYIVELKKWYLLLPAWCLPPSTVLWGWEVVACLQRHSQGTLFSKTMLGGVNEWRAKWKPLRMRKNSDRVKLLPPTPIGRGEL